MDLLNFLELQSQPRMKTPDVPKFDIGKPPNHLSRYTIELDAIVHMSSFTILVSILKELQPSIASGGYSRTLLLHHILKALKMMKRQVLHIRIINSKHLVDMIELIELFERSYRRSRDSWIYLELQ